MHENILSNPAAVTDDDCADYLTRRGRGWVCEEEGRIAGFAVADLQDDNILLPWKARAICCTRDNFSSKIF